MNSNPQRIDLNLPVETPENVVLTYTLAGPAIRCVAYLIDFAVRGLVLVLLSVFLACAGFALPGFSGGLLLLALFLLEWGYFVACEVIADGKSVGKHCLGLRVVQEHGHPVSVWASLQRNLLRAADTLPLYGPAFVAMLLSPKFARLGDLAAGTVVIQEHHTTLPREPVILEKIAPLPRESLSGYVPDERTLLLIDEFLARNHVLSYERGHALAAELAQVLADRLDYHDDRRLVEQFSMAFLARVYVTFLRREENDEATETERKPSENIATRSVGRRAVQTGSGR